MTKKNYKTYHGNKGFTLVELLITMVVASIAMGGILSVYVSQSTAYTVHDDYADMQQKLRAAMYLIKNDIRNAGRNPLMNGTVGIVDVGWYNADNNSTDDGYPGITMTSFMDTDGDGIANLSAIQTISYQVMDADGDNRRELRRQVNNSGNWALVMDGIEDIGFAYAYDSNNDLDLDRAGGGANATIIWAVDTDDTDGLDTNADSNGDGNIDTGDYNGTSGDIDTVAGDLGTQVSLRDIRAVQIWLLARSEREFKDFSESNTYVMGYRQLDFSAMDADDPLRRYRHVLLSGAVAMNNFERRP